MSNAMVLSIEEITSQLIEWRRKLHMNPEVSFQEVETAQFIVQELGKVPGMKVETEVGYPTAVVGTLSSGSGPAIALRADIDALPIYEENNHNYKSRNEGVMHACGHDAHTAIALGTATLLGKKFENGEMHGTVKFLFQPAEEMADEHGSTGAPYMIQAGALDNVDCVIALHMSPENELGEVKVHDGYSMANVDVFEAVISGTGGHGAYPHLGTDPIWMLGPLLQALHGVVARRISPLEPAVISLGSVHCGSASNVIPSEVTMNGTIRSYDPNVRTILHAELEKAFSVVHALGGEYQLKITPEDPALKNDPVVNELLRRTITDLYPDYKMLNTPFGLGGEDFAHMTQAIPGAMFFLGCAVSDGKVRDLHTPNFDIDERVLPVGVAILEGAVARFLKNRK
ncbi:amidohydrolase [Virgibacillus sp. C22-A2]|uniref:Amidohydrolase n=1 Tax=Virgibacillus tibetensis TaxID=3042313 RepID=A0ABU6KD54_9BACI|nr:amidohydrolase [Virgibacillus sp. C22-A2]